MTRIAGERNRGQDGWVYKVDRQVGSAGAGDRSGRRLRGGDRLLWFCCRMQRAGSCQRTLEATPDRTTAAPGEMLRVTVRGYDDQGHGVAVPGATVRLGSATATTDAGGIAELAVPASGRLARHRDARGHGARVPRGGPRRMRRALAIASLLAALAAASSGCGFGPGEDRRARAR